MNQQIQKTQIDMNNNDKKMISAESGRQTAGAKEKEGREMKRRKRRQSVPAPKFH
ncbi:hypothetical protein [Serratia entomophila]|uniref:hypothetical protein n=1 Tax=Serratia entomophila TaxID=42906 RepID=UPI0021BAA0E6|nr:hypothetical protein [Serratia entomophila]